MQPRTDESTGEPRMTEDDPITDYQRELLKLWVEDLEVVEFEIGDFARNRLQYVQEKLANVEPIKVKQWDCIEDDWHTYVLE